MQKYIPILKRTKLFAGVADNEIDAMLSCLDARLHEYKKGEYVLHEGEHLNHITVLVSGELHIQRDDYWGIVPSLIELPLERCSEKPILPPKVVLC